MSIIATAKHNFEHNRLFGALPKTILSNFKTIICPSLLVTFGGQWYNQGGQVIKPILHSCEMPCKLSIITYHWPYLISMLKKSYDLYCKIIHFDKWGSSAYHKGEVCS